MSSILSWAASALALCVSCASSAAEPIAFSDMNGRQVRLSGPAQRTVMTPMPGSAIYTAVNRGTTGLVGMHPSSHDNLPTMLLPQIFPQMAQVRHDITRGGFTPNVESLLQINPDIVWQWGHMGDELLTPLKAAGLNAAAIRLGQEAEVRQWLTLFATSLGKPERATEMIAWRQRMQDKVRAQVSRVPQAERLRVLYLSRYKTGIGAAGAGSTFQFDAEVAGGINVNDSQAAAPTINIEQLLIWNPQVIVLTNFERSLTPEALMREPLLAQLDAVRNQRVYKVPAGGYYWDPPNQDSPLYWIWLAKLLYPQAVTLDLRAELRSAYRLLYGFEISQAQIDQVLHWDLNRHSANYTSAFAAPQALAQR